MSIEVLTAEAAPAAIGPYSHGMKSGGFIFTSGQCPFYPGSGEVETDVRKAAALVLRNVLAVVEAGGGTRESIVKMELFVRDLGDFAAINEVYAEFFGEHKPARYCVQVAALPKNAVLEAAATAYVG